MLLDERPCNAQGISEFGRMSHRICFKDPGIKRAATDGDGVSCLQVAGGGGIPRDPWPHRQRLERCVADW